MSWWSRLFRGRSDAELKPQRLDYLSEALVLERQGDFDAALTSYRLALRDKPDDHRVLMNMAIAYSRLSRPAEAERCYRRVLEVKPEHPGAHYGLGFLLVRRSDRSGGEQHLAAFVSAPGKGAEEAHVAHARRALANLRSPAPSDDAPGDGPDQPGA